MWIVIRCSCFIGLLEAVLSSTDICYCLKFWFSIARVRLMGIFSGGNGFNTIRSSTEAES